MICEILCIGTELLHGDIVNSNAAYISKSLAKIGVDVHYQSVVGDNPDRMTEAFGLAFNRADVIICTGGLGPTKDDITKELAAKFFNVNMVYDEESYNHVVKMYSRYHKDLPTNNLRQTYFPEGSIILDNKHGTANACIINKKYENKDKICILLPGPPHEMSPLMDEEVIPYLKNFSNCIVKCKKVIVTNLGESKAEMVVMDMIDSQTNPTIASYCSPGKTMFRVTAKAKDDDEADKLINPIVEEMLKRFGENAIVLQGDGYEDDICQMIMDKNLTIATAESCTGGLIASKLVGTSGMSRSFSKGFVTYSNDAKISILGVKKDTIDIYTEVSEETAKEMAYNAARLANADIGVSSTGIAGPTGGTKDKPVGLVYVCIYYKGDYFVSRKVYFGDRNTVRERATLEAFELIRKNVL